MHGFHSMGPVGHNVLHTTSAGSLALSMFALDAGGFKTTGRPQPRRPGAAAQHKAPSRPPDKVLQHRTTEDQAVLYRSASQHVKPRRLATSQHPLRLQRLHRRTRGAGFLKSDDMAAELNILLAMTWQLS